MRMLHKPELISEWRKYSHLAAVDPDAAERGRLVTAQKVASDPEARQRGENAYGLDFMRAQYPEAYRSGWGRFLDRVRHLTPW